MTETTNEDRVVKVQTVVSFGNFMISYFDNRKARFEVTWEEHQDLFNVEPG